MGSSRDSYPLAGATSVDPHPSFPDLEQEVLAYWAADDTFRASVEQRPTGENGSNEYVFYDGPPFANGLPHYGHLLTGYVKDLVPRYQTMRGRRVERRFGWDTHGLPAELEAMDQLGIKTKEQILELGIERFNEACRASVLKYTRQWREYVTRQARWVDFDRDYKTLDAPYMESVIWAFKQLYDKGLIYEGFRVLPYCWNDQTPLSNHELRMDDDVYQLRRDPAVTVGLRLEATASGDAADPLSGALALVWTTTPWTLTANLAIMVHPEIDYLVVESDKPTGRVERYLLAEARLAAYRRELGEDVEEHVLARLTGSELLGRHYTPPMSYYTGHPGAFRVVEADFVTTGEGTGLVHTAGAFGEEDKMVTDREGIEPVVPVGPDGRFRYPVVDYEGLLVFDANEVIIDHLKAATRGVGDPGPVTTGTVLLRRESYEHSYPHCWRCRNPLIYMAVSSWFVEVTAFKQRMVELNQQINWVPPNVRDGQFGKWLSNARDWSITRNRFWGSPVPVWKSDNPAYPRIDVYGSFAELERDFGELPMRTDPETGERTVDLHRPSIDRLTRANPDDPTGQSTMRRVEDVLDVWFDSGSMSYAQVHYPFDSSAWFAHHFPADFIVEYIGQTRGWFYMLHILATALFDKPAFTNVICHGIVLGSDGQKMSKSLRNYPDVTEVFDRDGADAMRWFLMSSAILRGGNLIVTEEGIREGVRQAILPLWNAWYFLALYAGASGGQEGAAGSGEQENAAGSPRRGRVGVRRTDSRDVLDRYILAKTAELVAGVTGQLDVYDVAGACATVRAYVEVLTNWYIRRSRQRFWDGDVDAIDTLHTVLETVCRVAAPLLPLITETVWRGLTGGRSVHLTDWPALDELPADPGLVAAMDRAREVASTALAVRKAAGLRVRQPLAAMLVSTEDADALQQFSALLADEVNVATVTVVDLAESDERVRQRLTVNARAAGPRLGRDVQQVIKAAKSDDWSVSADGVVTCGGHVLVDGEYTLELVAADDDSGALGVLPGAGYVFLDTNLSDELVADGVVNDLLRVIQQARRDAGLQVSDRISVVLEVSDDLWAAVVDRMDRVAAETLAVAIHRFQDDRDASAVTVDDADSADAVGTVGTVGDGQPVRVIVRRADV